MNEKFSLYLTKIGFLNKDSSETIIKPGNNSQEKPFIDSAFNLLMDYFNNLNEEQKKFMSYSIPSNFIMITDKIKKEKMKSIIIHFNLRKKIILLKYFFIWKINIHFYNINNKKSIFKKYIDNVSLYHLVNIDRNIDVDDRNYIKADKNEQKNKKLYGNIKTNTNKNKKISLSYFNNNLSKEKNRTMIYNNINNNFSQNKENISDNKQNINQNEIKSYNYKNNKIIKINKITNNPKNNKYTNNYINTKTINKNNEKNSQLLTSLEKKEKIELEECFFRPKINKPKKIYKNFKLVQSKNNSFINNKKIDKEKQIQTRFEKLYKDSEKYKISKEMKAVKLDSIENRKLTFVPKKYTKIRKFKSDGNFEKRQENFLRKKKRHSLEIKNEINSLYEAICSFNPKITNEKGEYYNISDIEKISKPVFKRLYEDGRKRQYSQAQQENEKINKIINLSNILNPEKTFNFSTINRLYEYKEKQEIMNRTKRKVEEEEGATFKPYVPENFYTKNINRTFMERNEKFIKDKEYFYEEENKKQNDIAKRNCFKKDYTNKEKQEIIRNIIKRLYNDNKKETVIKE